MAFGPTNGGIKDAGLRPSGSAHLSLRKVVEYTHWTVIRAVHAGASPSGTIKAREWICVVERAAFSAESIALKVLYVRIFSSDPERLQSGLQVRRWKLTSRGHESSGGCKVDVVAAADGEVWTCKH